MQLSARQERVRGFSGGNPMGVRNRAAHKPEAQAKEDSFACASGLCAAESCTLILAKLSYAPIESSVKWESGIFPRKGSRPATPFCRRVVHADFCCSR